jgi:TetR/AcrR family transcriptional repressor of nem operon
MGLNWNVHSNIYTAPAPRFNQAMARTRCIADDTVLDRATALFWQRGYAATSLRDLTAATGLGAAALYHRFGDKDRLFLAVLRRYAEQRLQARLARLAALPSPLGAIGGFFDELIDASLADPDRRGCLLVNTALDGAATSPEARAAVRARLGEIEGFFRASLLRARERGEIDAATDADAAAEALLAAVLAIRVLARLDPDAARRRPNAAPALAPRSPPEKTR